MDGLEFDMSDFDAHLDVKEIAVEKASAEVVTDAGDDLARIASNIAPILSGALRQSIHAEKVRRLKRGYAVDVVASATENSEGYGRFNYALWTHEQDYELGDQSKAAPGTDGYEVGNKYLERPLKGESQKYVDWFAKAVKEALD